MDRLSFEKVFYHWRKLYKYMETGDCYPVHMIIGLTNICNHRCVWCYGQDTMSSHGKNHDLASKEMIISTVKEAASHGLRSLSLVGTGEPTLHPDFTEIVTEIKAAGVEIGLFTNGSLLDGAKEEAVLNTHTFIRLSCSAANREEHNRLHHAGRQGNDFEWVVENTRSLLKKRVGKNRPTIGVQYAVSHLNWQSLAVACRLWKEVGVDYFSIKPVYKNSRIESHEENSAPLDQVFQLMSEAKSMENDSFKVYAKFEQFDRVLGKENKNRGYTVCHGQAFTTFLDPDGNLFTCGNLHGQEQFRIGNVVREGSFQAVWEGKRRAKILGNLDVTKCPVGCRMDPLNLLIEDLKHPDPEIHSNFL